LVGIYQVECVLAVQNEQKKTNALRKERMRSKEPIKNDSEDDYRKF